MVFLKYFLLICFVHFSSYASEIASSDLIEKTGEKTAHVLKFLPVQAGGRIKPFDTFAKETIEFISGRKKSSVHIVMTWILLPHIWDKTPFVLIEKSSIKKSLELNPELDRFSPYELSQNKNLHLEISELKIKKERGEKLSDYLSGIEKLESRLNLYQAIRQGYLPLWLPQEDGSSWLSARELKGEKKKIFVQMLNQYSQTMSSGDDQNFLKAVESFYSLIPSGLETKIKMEVQYNALHPFRWAWILYLLAFFCFMLLPPQFRNKISLFLFISAFILHTYGIILRSYIMSRPPVTNMFETLLWVPWAAFVFACIFAFIKRKFFPILIGGICAFFCLFLSDTAEPILNGKLEPLTAVLRSNFWLSTHVLIITISYSFFFLSFITGDFLIFQFLLGKKESDFKNYLWFIYRCLQAGVLFLALGTILGGIWADYSWGRFWGWDPKEVWALVSLLGYLALLHARIQGWIKGFGLAIGSICCFFLIIMAWYGVNFVLGQGLHSYGFGQGGLPYVLVFAVLHLLFIVIAWRKIIIH